jgi:hypothetical protein
MKRYLLFPLAAALSCLCCGGTAQSTDGAGSSSETVTPAPTETEVPGPEASEVFTVHDTRYLAVLDCCWSVSVFVIREPLRILDFRFDILKLRMPERKLLGAPEAFRLTDGNRDGDQEIFWSWCWDSCVLESGAILFDVASGSLFQLNYRKGEGLTLSTNLEGDKQAVFRDWLIRNWRKQKMHSINLPDRLPVKYADIDTGAQISVPR